MTVLEQVEFRLRSLERRARLFASAQGIAVTTITALVLTLVLVCIANRLRFAAELILPLRLVLFAGIASVIALSVALPVFRINRRRVVARLESELSELDGRLTTVVERPDTDNPFTELIAADALDHLHATKTERVLPGRVLYASAAIAGAACAVLIWLIVAGPGYWGYGSALLWTGTAHAARRPLYDIAVEPGDRTVRRKSDQVIAARLVGFSTPNVLLHAKYRGSAKWDALPMSPKSGSEGYQLLFAGLADSLDYYVEAGGIRSKHYTIGVKDLPAVKRLRVTVRYPSGLGVPDSVQDPGGDIRAVEGSQAQISVLTDKPLANGTLVFEDGSRVPLRPGHDSWMSGSLAIRKDGSYHVAESDGAETVRISDDFFIEASKDEPPAVRIVRPGRDPHVSPIEEVPVSVEASDDFGLRTVQLHYSVNGGPEQVKPLITAHAPKSASADTTLFFEDFKLQPGDLVSFYATAQDASHTSRTDILFAQAEPFDFKFRQSQQAGGGMGGGGGDQQNQISERQKQIIAATWNQVKGGKQDAALVAENARFLSDLEKKLGAQADALASRMGNRDLTGVNPEFERFSKEMTEASEQMNAAAGQLNPGKWDQALPPEQKALQSLLRAESIFRDIQVAYGQQGGGGAGAGGEQRELSRLFDLELDSSKNQYETGQSVSPPGSDQQKKLDEALEKLKELARRQQELAQQQRTTDQQFQQRWEEEQLRREAEQLRRDMQQMAANSQSQSGQQSSGQQGTQQSRGSQQSRAGRQSGSAMPNGSREQKGAVQQALDAMQRAEEEMRTAASHGDKAAQARAAGQLAQAQDAISKMLHEQSASSLSELSEQARQLAEQQKQLADKIKGLYGASGINTAPPPKADGSRTMPEMDGPDYAGGWFRRRAFSEGGHPATPRERNLAGNSEELARQTQQLQEELQRQAQAMQGTQPESTRQLRRALSEAEQEDLALRMQKGADWLREGFGEQVWPQEDSITAGVQQLSKRLDQVRESVGKSGDQTAQSGDGRLQQALSEIRNVREQLQAKSGSRRSGAQSNAQAGGEPDISQGGEQAEEAVQDLNSLRSEFGRNDRQFDNTLGNAIGSLRRINSEAGRFDSILNQDAITNLARVELELTRRLSVLQLGAREGAPEAPAERYREALANYYRQLSK